MAFLVEQATVSLTNEEEHLVSLTKGHQSVPIVTITIVNSLALTIPFIKSITAAELLIGFTVPFTGNVFYRAISEE